MIGRKQLPESDISDSPEGKSGDKRKRDGSVSREHSPQRSDNVAHGDLGLHGAAPSAPSAGRPSAAPSTGHSFVDLGRADERIGYDGPYKGYGMDELLVAADHAEDLDDYFEIQAVIDKLGALQQQAPGPVDDQIVSPDDSGASVEGLPQREQQPPQPVGGGDHSQYVTAEDLNSNQSNITGRAPAVTTPESIVDKRKFCGRTEKNSEIFGPKRD